MLDNFRANVPKLKRDYFPSTVIMHVAKTIVEFMHLHCQIGTRVFWSFLILAIVGQNYADSGGNMASLLVAHLLTFFCQLPMTSS